MSGMNRKRLNELRIQAAEEMLRRLTETNENGNRCSSATAVEIAEALAELLNIK